MFDLSNNRTDEFKRLCCNESDLNNIHNLPSLVQFCVFPISCIGLLNIYAESCLSLEVDLQVTENTYVYSF